MDTPIRACTAFALIALLPAAALAQGGKIDDVERTARSGGSSSSSSSDNDCGFLCHVFLGLLFHHHDEPASPAAAPTGADSAAAAARARKDSAEMLSYGRYPWGGPRLDQHFVTAGPVYRPRFGVTSVSWFKDAASSLSGISLDIEGGFPDVYLAGNLTQYREPTPQGTDKLTTVRVEGGGLEPMGRGFLSIGIGGRLVFLDNGDWAPGMDFALGARVLPARPVVLSARANIGVAKWDGGDYFLTTEYTATAAVVLGPVELGGGWHWLKLGSANAFGGPVLSARVWF